MKQERTWRSALRLLQPYVHHADQAVGHRLEILQSRRVGDQVLRMEEIDHPSLGQELRGDLLVDRLAGRQVTGGPGLPVPGIDVLVAVTPRVQRRAAGL